MKSLNVGAVGVMVVILTACIHDVPIGDSPTDAGTDNVTSGSGGAATGSGGSGGATTGSGGDTVGTTTGSGGTSATGGDGGAGGFGSTGGSGGSAGTGGASGAAGGSSACFCTRRPGVGVSLKCPAGIDESATATIGLSGGSVELRGRQGIGVAARLTVPPSAFNSDVEVKLVETSIPPPSDFSDWSPVYELLPGGVTTSSLMALKVPWGNKDGNVPPITVYMAKDRNSPFTPLPDAYLNAGFSEASITEFGLFFVGVPKSAVGQTACP